MHCRTVDGYVIFLGPSLFKLFLNTYAFGS
ncbi:hypothetical protein HU200_022326 [Digitaria exilis]|uniref:Uncharacterized protein n=1 Tax=Digitaria exilis TaxID=1010633 RepID=A0A835CAM8_9POAL|nr:hypothetical protein HU200_022326 [Digitaria exilis]